MDLRADIEDFKELVESDSKILNTISDLHFLASFLHVYPEYSDTLTSKQLEELITFVDHKGTNIKDTGGKKLVFSYINFKNETLYRMHMLGVIGYTYQSLEEYGLKDTDMYIKKIDDKQLEADKKVIKAFLDHLFRYDPNRHIRDCYGEYKDKELNKVKKVFYMPEETKKEIEKLMENPLTTNVHEAKMAEYARQGISYNDSYNTFDKAPEDLTLDEALKLNDWSNEKKQYMKDFVDFTNKKDANKLKHIAPLPSADLFANYDRYVNMYYNEIYGLTHILFGLSTQVSFGILPYMFTSNKQSIDKFEEENGHLIKMPVSVIGSDGFTFLGPWRQNKENVIFQLDNKARTTIDPNRAMRNADYDTLRNEMVKLKADKIKKERKLDEKDKIALKKYAENMGQQDVINEALSVSNKKERDDSLNYNVIVTDFRTGETKEGNLPLGKKIM